MTQSKLTSKTVLVVDDEVDLRDIVASELEFMGANIFTAENIIVAQEILKKEKIDLVISDIRMPGGTGIELLEHIKSKYSVSLPVMLITGFADITTEGAHALGAEALISKPFKLDDLILVAEKFSQSPEERLGSISEKAEQVSIKTAKQVHIGRGGAALELAERFVAYEVGQKVNLNISSIVGEGIIRWVKSSGEHSDNTWVGVEFTSLDSQGKLLVKEKIEKGTLQFIPSSQG